MNETESLIRKFETKNIYIIILAIIVFYLSMNLFFTIGFVVSELKNTDIFHLENEFLQVKVYVIFILTVAYFIIVYLYIKHKPKKMNVLENGIEFTHKEETIFLEFAQIENISINSHKIVTSEKTFRFPLSLLKNVDQFAILLKHKLADKIPLKALKQIELIIINRNMNKHWKKWISPMILFFLIFYFIIFKIIDLSRNYHFTFWHTYISIMTGFIILAIQSITIQNYYKKNYDVETNTTAVKAKFFWLLNAITLLIWIIVLILIVLFSK